MRYSFTCKIECMPSKTKVSYNSRVGGELCVAVAPQQIQGTVYDFRIKTSDIAQRMDKTIAKLPRAVFQATQLFRYFEYFQAQRSTVNKILSINSVRSWVALAISPSKSIDFWTVEKPRRRRACPIQNDDCKVSHKLIHLRITILIIKQ